MSAAGGRVVIAGASGLIGRALVRRLAHSGFEVRRLVRRGALAPDEIEWDPVRGSLGTGALEGALAVVNLAGESVDQRWTESAKRRIRDSRVRSTELLARTIASCADKPRVLVSGSAIGYYGAARGDDVLDERASSGDDFLARLCVDWEGATLAASEAGVRVCHARTGIVLSREGGALARMLPLFRRGLGGKLGGGRQWMSWITLEDEVRAIESAIVDDDLRGPINLCAPNPVTNAEFTRALADELHRPAHFHVPAFALSLALGEMARGAVLASQRATPGALERAGFVFSHADIVTALAAVFT